LWTEADLNGVFPKAVSLNTFQFLLSNLTVHASFMNNHATLVGLSDPLAEWGECKRIPSLSPTRPFGTMKSLGWHVLVRSLRDGSTARWLIVPRPSGCYDLDIFGHDILDWQRLE